MNKAITGAWAQAGSRRSAKISLNAPSPQASPSPAPSTSAAVLTKEEVYLPPKSAAAAAAQREAEAAQNPGTDEGVEESAPTTPGGTDTENVRVVAKRKARLTAGAANGAVTSNGNSSSTKRRKATSSSSNSKGVADSTAQIPTARLKDLGGVSNALDKILELIAVPLCHPEVYTHTGIKPPRGVLLHGPPGCGKTMLASALAGDLNVPLLSVSAPSIVSGTSGESEQTLRQLFEEATKSAPCILFLDEIDAITPKRETAQREMERRIVAQLLTCLDDLTWDKTDGKPVMVIGATNRPDSLDPALRRAGRFDHEIALGVPDEAGREEILRILCSSLHLSGDFNLRALAKATPGYVGADLVALTAAAGIRAVKRIFSELAGETQVQQHQEEAQADVEMLEGSTEERQAGVQQQPEAVVDIDVEIKASTEEEKSHLREEEANEQTIHSRTRAMPSSSLFEALPPSLKSSSIAIFLQSNQGPLANEQLDRLRITPIDFELALPSIQPSSKREGFATVPEVTWSDVGALQATREELEMTIVEPIKRPELFASVGVTSSGGVLLWGPPGCGKTLLAKAVANESGANFISVKGPELLNKYVGESERAVRQVFARARTSSPCVIFFDELDALVPRRDDALSESSSRVVNTLLTELDGLEARAQTYVIGATNRPDMIDPAMCRPGRLDKLLYVDLPTAGERHEILITLTKKTPLGGDIDLQTISFDSRLEGFSGADLAALTREASVLALRQTLRDAKLLQSNSDRVLVLQEHFVLAMAKVSPSVGPAQRLKYERLRHRLSGLPMGKEQSATASANASSNANGHEAGEPQPAM